MENRKQVNIILSIAYLFTVITCIFLFISRSMENIYYSVYLGQDRIGNAIKAFLFSNIIMIIAASIITIILRVKIKKSNQIDYFDIKEKEQIHLITGILVVIQGLTNLSYLLPSFITRALGLIKSQPQDVRNILMLRNAIIGDSISVIIILCQLFLGIYLVKYIKKKQTDIAMLRSVLLYTVITSIFSLFDRLSVLISGLGDEVRVFSINNILWAVIIVISIIMLILKIRKSNQTGYLSILENGDICMAAGVLIIVHGLLNLSTDLQYIIIHMIAFLQTPIIKSQLSEIIVQYIISMVITLVQIVLGFYLAKYYKKKKN
ncbi:hypothetical protein OXPF_04010 [Oxobacter pfennigii]|uniref:Uncharacterized protein n=1 Tax=Oxobacter pfennigii TaxID=36849 RepID=A0A0P8WDW7_9CLOT|nr:hypothetical protein [Oxobacter pfennigii]KPU45933.1 hypothetical protein OXPF_04010 [Oxobacter pfennigii]